MPLDSVGFLTGVVADLVAGRDYIEQRGWCQHQSRDGMRVCALGGVFEATGGQVVIVDDNFEMSEIRREAACEALQRALDARLLGRFKLVSCWNDEPGRTVDDVLALYDLAIERELKG